MIKNQQSENLVLAFIDLARVRIVGMVLISCAIGFILAYRGHFACLRFCCTLAGTGLLSGGSCALNCYLERKWDALMPRTCRRPIPAGVISPARALAFGASLILTGCLLLANQVSILCAFLGMTAVFIYLGIYTPAKRLTWLNTTIGAVPGAIPPLIGWASAAGRIDAGGWILFAMLLLWQHTHFFPIAWLYKNDYELAGFHMLPVLENRGEKTFLLTALTAVALLPISLLLYGSDFVGFAYCCAALTLGAILIAAAFHLSRQPSRRAAHFVLFLSLCYLPLIFTAVLIDRYSMPIGSHFHEWLETVCKWT